MILHGGLGLPVTDGNGWQYRMDGLGGRGPVQNVSQWGWKQTLESFTRRVVCMQQREFERTPSVQVFSPSTSRPLAFPLPSLVNIKTICVAKTRERTVPKGHCFAHCNQSQSIGFEDCIRVY